MNSKISDYLCNFIQPNQVAMSAFSMLKVISFNLTFFRERVKRCN